MKVVFLDIDGVLNSRKTMLLHGSVFIDTPRVREKLDPYGCLFLQRLCERGVHIVLSSTWRLGSRFLQERETAFPFPVLDRTCSHPFPGSTRGDEIQQWLNQHPEVTHYVILDDDSDMLDTQQSQFVKILPSDGLRWEDMERVCELLGFNIWELRQRQQFSSKD